MKKGKRVFGLQLTVMNVNIGRRDEQVIQAMTDQLRELPFAPGMATKPQARCSEEVGPIAPIGANKIPVYPGGADANKKCHRLRGQHGQVQDSWRATAHIAALRTARQQLPAIRAGLPGADGHEQPSSHFLDPYRYRSTFRADEGEISDEEFTRDCLRHLEEIIFLFEDPATIAAVMDRDGDRRERGAGPA